MAVVEESDHDSIGRDFDQNFGTEGYGIVIDTLTECHKD